MKRSRARWLLIGVWLFETVAVAQPRRPQTTADVIFFNGTVLTIDATQSVGEAIAISGDSILAVGSNGEISRMGGPNTIRVDLDGRTLMPGFVDPHSHMPGAVFGQGFPDIFGPDYNEGQQRMLDAGITTLAEAAGWGFFDDLLSYLTVGEQRVRVSIYAIYNDHCGYIPPEDWYLDYTDDFPTDPTAMVRMPGIKIFTPEELAAVIAQAESRGLQAMIHTLGDVAIDVAFEALETALDGRPNVLRHRFEHNLTIRDDQLARYGELGVPAVLLTDLKTCSVIDGGLWSFLLNPQAAFVRPWLHPWRSMFDANPGHAIAWHSDTPWVVKNAQPLAEAWALVTRKYRRENGSVCEPLDWMKEQAITIEEALQSMTIHAAYAMGMDSYVGSLEPGKFADLIVLSEDPTIVEPDALLDIEVLLTMVGGSVEHCVTDDQDICQRFE